MKTYSPKSRDIERRWYVIDAQGAVLGRLASEVAKILRGKHKPIFAPHADTGDHVIVVNARGVRLTGNKERDKVLYQHSGYPGGLRRLGYARVMSERPSLAVQRAVRGMLPKNRLGRQMIKKLAVYEGAGHPHAAQRPQALQLGTLPKWEGLPKREAPPVPTPTAPRASSRPRRPARAGGTTTGRARATGTGRTRRVPAPRTAPARASKAGAVTGRGTARSRPRGTGAATSRSTAKAGGGQAKSTKSAPADAPRKPPRTRRGKRTKES